MTRPNTAALAPLAALLALMVVRCKGDSDPTGWIPRNGSVTGTVAVSSALPAAPLTAALDATVPAVPLAVPLPTGLDAFRARGPGDPRPGRLRRRHGEQPAVCVPKLALRVDRSAARLEREHRKRQRPGRGRG